MLIAATQVRAALKGQQTKLVGRLSLTVQEDEQTNSEAAILPASLGTQDISLDRRSTHTRKTDMPALHILPLK